MASIRGLSRNQQPLTLDIHDGDTVTTINLEYRPRAWTDELQEALGETGPGVTKRLNHMLVELIAGWDLTLDDDDPAPIPISMEGMRELDVPLKNAIGLAISQHIADPNRLTASRPGSAAGANGALSTSPTFIGSSG